MSSKGSRNIGAAKTSFLKPSNLNSKFSQTFHKLTIILTSIQMNNQVSSMLRRDPKVALHILRKEPSITSQLSARTTRYSWITMRRRAARIWQIIVQRGILVLLTNPSLWIERYRTPQWLSVALQLCSQRLGPRRKIGRWGIERREMLRHRCSVLSTTRRPQVPWTSTTPSKSTTRWVGGARPAEPPVFCRHSVPLWFDHRWKVLRNEISAHSGMAP